jgi:hypothetical protein
MNRTNVATLVLMALAVSALPASAVVLAADDPRQRLVTLSCCALPVEEVLEELGESAGVHLTAVRHLRDRRMTLFVQDRPLGEALEAVARLWSLPGMPARWTALAGGTGFELRQSARAATEGERREALERSAMLAAMHRLQELLEESVDLESSAPLGPQGALWNMRWAVAAGALLRNLPEGAWPDLAGGQTGWLSVPQLPLATQETVFRQVAMRHLRGHLRPGADAANPGPGDVIPETADQRRTRFNTQQVRLAISTRSNGRWVGELALRDEDGGTQTRGGLGPVAGFSEDDEIKREQRRLNGGRERRGIPLAEEQRQRLREAPPRGHASLAELFETLHRVTGRTVAADHYANVANRFGPAWTALPGAASERFLQDALEKITEPVGYRYYLEKEALVFRCKPWWAFDRGEVPRALTRQVTDQLATAGALELSELASLTQLSPEQLSSARLELLPEEAHPVLQVMQVWLALYAHLPDRERKRLTSEEGLPLRQLPDPIRELLGRATGTAPSPSLHLRLWQEALTVPPRGSVLRTSVRLFEPGQEKPLFRHISDQPIRKRGESTAAAGLQ